MYKSTFCSLKMGPKNCPQLIHGLKTDIRKSSGQIFIVTIAYLKENSKIKDVFQENSYQEIRKTFLGAPKWGVDLYTGSTYTRVNTVLQNIFKNTSKQKDIHSMATL